MIAYDKKGLDNSVLHEQADEALAAHAITPEEWAGIQAQYPVPFYSPNNYIRIGLFLLTSVIVSFSLGLLALVTLGGSGGFGPVLFIFGSIVYGVLEYWVYRKRHFRSGIDDALMWMSGGLILSGIWVTADPSGMLLPYLLLFLISAWCCLRFGDRIMALISYAALLAILVERFARQPGIAEILLPFVIMAVAAVTSFLSHLLYSAERCRHYRPCISILKAAGLISFYLAGNVFVLREWAAGLPYSPTPSGMAPGMLWLFWTLTVVTPIFYVVRGLKRKDIIFLWAGLVLIAATVATIRQYAHLLPIEYALSIGGILLIAIAYTSIRYLRKPRHQYTYRQMDGAHFIELLQIESLVIQETLQPAPPAPNDFQFGGGSSGGGGAGGTY